MTEFISNFVQWLGQFVVVSIVLMIATHLFAKKRRAQKRREQQLAEEQGDVTESAEQAEETTPVSVV